MPLKNNFFLLVVLLALGNIGGALAQTQENGSRQENTSLSDSNDCTNISVDYENDPNLTQQEKIQLMDKALFHSLSKYESCQNNHSSAGGGGSSGGSQGSGGAAGGGSGASTASAEMSGTETSETETSENEASAAQQASSASSNGKTNADALAINEKPDAHTESIRAKGSGKTPDDIPPVDNDSVLEAQIRQAAMNEQDPIIKEKLWNEYRKYKGLPVKKP
ncbi:MAG: hypothetical protein Q9M25_10320 [Mariprofundaceae bacterium]|nr:hypothetical protein [Mariprofundaceae bacterium]